MGTRNIARDGKAEADTTGLKVAAFIQPVKGAEGFLAPGFRDACAIVIDNDFGRCRAAHQCNIGMGGIFQCVIDQIGDAAFQGVALDGECDRFGNGDLQAVFPGLLGAQCIPRRFLEQGGDIGRGRFLPTFATGEFQIFVQHPLHIVDIGAQGRDVGGFLHQGELQFEPGQRRLQIVADAGQHVGALLHITVDPLPHGEEGFCGAAHFGGAIGLEIGHGAALAEAFRSKRQPLDRAHLIAQKDDGNTDKDDRGADQPDDENIGTRHRDPVARHQHAQHAVVNLHPDVHQLSLAADLEMALAADLLRNHLIQRLVDGALPAVGMARGRYMRTWIEADLIAQHALRLVAQDRPLLLR